jgi:1-acyl-sn-glycerol-3-phosphate acyltransferase
VVKRSHRPHTPLPLRFYRSARAGVHVAEALATIALVFPWIGVPRNAALIRRCPPACCGCCAWRRGSTAFPKAGLPGNLLIVANHVSWLDIFVLNAVQPSRFVGKAELRTWPIVGRLVTACGTLYIERERRRDTHAVNRHAAHALARGDVVAIFPEGTTTDGRDILPFRGSLLQPIVDAGGHVQPIALRYRTPAGEHSDAPAYVGETSFIESFWRLTGEPRLVVELHVAAPLPARARHRRELTRAAEAAIRTVLAPPDGGPAPGRSAGPPAAPP